MIQSNIVVDRVGGIVESRLIMEEYSATSKQEADTIIDNFYEEHALRPCDPALKQVLLMQFDRWGKMEIGIQHTYLVIHKIEP
jgi:hypothetical protein